MDIFSSTNQMSKYNKDEKKYLKRTFGGGVSLAGFYLVWEHIWSWGEFTFWDFIGHEWLGLILILVGIGVNINCKKK